LINTGEGQDWSYCQWECGLFEARIKEDPNRLLIVFTKDTKQLPRFLEGFRSLAVGEDSVYDLLKQLYLEAPWSVFSGVDTEPLRTAAKQISDGFHRSMPIAANFDLVPGFSMELTLDEECKRTVTSGKFPDNTIVSGTRDWLSLFGKKIDTSGWHWGDLTAKWPYRELYEYEFARMVTEALTSQSPQGCFLRVEDSKNLYRVGS
jgi:hypothetical protein